MTLIEAAKLALEALTESKEHIAKHKRLEAITSLDQAISEAEQQEPYAYAYMGVKHDGALHGPHLVWKPEYMDAMSASRGAVAVPIYIHPPKHEWQGLSWEEIDECFKITPDQYLPAQIYKRIEAKLKEKNT